MSTPGFTAEASLYQMSGYYKSVAAWGNGVDKYGISLAQGPRPGCGDCVPNPAQPDRGRFTGFTRLCCFGSYPYISCFTLSCIPTVTCGSCTGTQTCTSAGQSFTQNCSC
jgi:hypothetical protein